MLRNIDNPTIAGVALLTKFTTSLKTKVNDAITDVNKSFSRRLIYIAGNKRKVNCGREKNIVMRKKGRKKLLLMVAVEPVFSPFVSFHPPPPPTPG